VQIAFLRFKYGLRFWVAAVFLAGLERLELDLHAQGHQPCGMPQRAIYLSISWYALAADPSPVPSHQPSDSGNAHALIESEWRLASAWAGTTGVASAAVGPSFIITRCAAYACKNAPFVGLQQTRARRLTCRQVRIPVIRSNARLLTAPSSRLCAPTQHLRRADANTMAVFPRSEESQGLSPDRC